MAPSSTATRCTSGRDGELDAELGRLGAQQVELGHGIDRGVHRWRSYGTGRRDSGDGCTAGPVPARRAPGARRRRRQRHRRRRRRRPRRVRRHGRVRRRRRSTRAAATADATRWRRRAVPLDLLDPASIERRRRRRRRARHPRHHAVGQRAQARSSTTPTTSSTASSTSTSRARSACAARSARRWPTAGRGSMIGFSSIRSQTTEPGQGAYAATKAATVMLFKTLAAELGPRGVRANTIAPGVVETPLTAADQGPARVVRRRTPTRRSCGAGRSPSEMVGAVVYLASDASSYVTGTTLFVDGGWTAADGRFDPADLTAPSSPMTPIDRRRRPRRVHPASWCASRASTTRPAGSTSSRRPSSSPSRCGRSAGTPQLDVVAAGPAQRDRRRRRRRGPGRR